MSRYLRNYFKNKEECINYFKRLWDDNNGDEQLKEAEANGTKEIRLHLGDTIPPFGFMQPIIEQLENEVYGFFIWQFESVDYKTGTPVIIMSWRDPYEITRSASLMYLESMGKNDE